MTLRRGKERLHFPCDNCGKMFERQRGERLCPVCYYERRKQTALKRIGWRKYKDKSLINNKNIYKGGK